MTSEIYNRAATLIHNSTLDYGQILASLMKVYKLTEVEADEVIKIVMKGDEDP